MAHYLTLAGRRTAIVNLDPANEHPPYAPAVDVGDLVSLEGVMREHGLGPNGGKGRIGGERGERARATGTHTHHAQQRLTIATPCIPPQTKTTGLIFCLDVLAANLDWLGSALAPLAESGAYVLFDLPGQTELFTGHPALRRVIDALTSGKGMGWEEEKTARSSPQQPPPPSSPAWRLVAVHLLDSVLCTDPAKYLAGCLDALGAMLHLELPHINVLSKVDRLRSYGRLAFDLSAYARCDRLGAVAAAITAGSGVRGRGPSWGARHARLTAALADCVEDYALLRFQPCAIEDEATVGRLAAEADRAAGWVPHPGAGVEGTGRDGALPLGVGDGDPDEFLEVMAVKYGLPALDDEWDGDSSGGGQEEEG